MVLIGIIRATHIQTKHKQTDEEEVGKKFSIYVTPRTREHMHTRQREKEKQSCNRAAAAASSDATFLYVSTADALSGSSVFIENT